MAFDYEARDNWHRYLYLRDRGHIEYTRQAAINEGMYLGGGLQWTEADKAVLDGEHRPWYEFNEVMPSVNAAIGHQIQNRMDIAFKPRGGEGDLFKATALSKVVMQVCDRTMLHWLETQVYTDGLIEQRGYYDVRMDFNTNMLGEVKVTQMDPRDVIPDCDAKAYDPDGWSDVTTTRWLTLDEIEGLYGKKAREAAKGSGDEGPDWGVLDEDTERNTFGTTGMVGLHDAYRDDEGLRRYRIIDRQKWVQQATTVFVWPETGEIRVADVMSEAQQQDALAQGAVKGRRQMKRVRWIVSTYCVTIFDEISPYEHFTIVPYFAYFRRGKTRGLVDNAIGPQQVLNKAVSQNVHIVNSAANSGWIVEEHSLANMDEDELEERGAQTGLVLVYKKGASTPAKIQPNQIPTGVDKLIDRATQALKDVTVPDAMRGLQGNAESGVAKERDQFASQQQLAVCLDNLAHTRHLLANRVVKLVQRYYDSYRVFKITEIDQRTGQQVTKTLEINKMLQDGSYWNDITIGTYDVVITEQPMSITFEQGQYQQALEMRREGIKLPDSTVVRYSSLADKQAIIEQMDQQDPMAAASLDKLKADTDNVRAKTMQLDVETIYSAIQTAGAIVMSPQVSPLADSLLGSVAFVDKDKPPIVPQLTDAQQQMNVVPAPDQAHPLQPLQPVSPHLGQQAGINTQAAEPA